MGNGRHLEQQGYQAPGIGPLVPQAIMNAQQAVLAENQTATVENFMSSVAVKSVFASVAIAGLVVGGTAKTKQTRTAGAAMLVVSLALFAVSIFVFPPQEKNYVPPSGDLLQRPDLLLPAGQPDLQPFPRAPEHPETIAMRYAAQGTDVMKLEGPRGEAGYYRGAATPDGRKTLSDLELMRSARFANMDAGTFEEYMRRLNGEAIPRVVQSHAYMPFAANWETRQQIDDSSRQFGITDQPPQANRKYNYKEPRIAQAGAKTSHLKDPPPGTVHVLEKTHPWIEDAETETPRIEEIVENPETEKAEASQEFLESFNEKQAVDEKNADASDEFFSGFLEKKIPNEETIERALKESKKGNKT